MGCDLLHGVRVEILENDAARAMGNGPPASPLRWDGFQTPHVRPPLVHYWQPQTLAHNPD